MNWYFSMPHYSRSQGDSADIFWKDTWQQPLAKVVDVHFAHLDARGHLQQRCSQQIFIIRAAKYIGSCFHPIILLGIFASMM